MKPIKLYLKNAGILFICLLSAVLVLIAFRTTSNAYGSSITFYGVERVPKHLRTYHSESYQPAFCFDANLQALYFDEGHEFKTTPESVDKVVSYLMLRTYPTTTYINGTHFNEDDAKLITQIAVWMYRDFITENGIIDASAGHDFENDIGRVPEFIYAHGDRVLNAAQSIIREAKEKGPTATIPEDLTSKLYIPLDSEYQRMLVGPEHPWGRVTLTKILNVPDELLSNPSYDITQIEFELTEVTQNTDKTFKLRRDSKNSKGYIAYDKDNPSHNYIDVAPGIYNIKEKNVPSGIIKGGAPSAFYIPAYTGEDSVVNIEISNTLKWIEVDDLIVKTTGSEKHPIPLAGAKFEVTHTDQGTTRRWILTSDAEGKVKLDKAHFVEGDSFFGEHEGKGLLPYGIVTIKEIAAPTGYKIDSSPHEVNLNDFKEDRKNFTPVKINNEAIRADIKFLKLDGDVDRPMKHIPFRITNTKTNESHIVFTDAKGVFNSSTIKHSTNTNGNDNLSAEQLQTGFGEGAPPDAGLWFNAHEGDVLRDGEGALPYGVYTLEELRSSENTMYQLIKMNFEIKSNETLDLGEILNWKTGLATRLKAQKTDGDSYKFIDTLAYTNIPLEKDYEIVTTYVVVGEDGNVEPLRINGEEYKQKTSFRPERRSGELDIETTFPKDVVDGKTIVCYEEILEGEKVVVSHKNPQDKDQTVVIKEEEIIHETGISKDMTTLYVACAVGLGMLIYIGFMKSRNVW